MSGKSQTVGDFIVSRPSQILPTNENIPDRLELSRTNLENRECFHFSGASQISAMVGDYSRQMKPQICTVGDVGDCRRWISGLYASDFSHYQSSKLLGSSPPITDKHGVSETMSDISATSCTVGKKLNPRSPGIFPTYENQA